MYNLSNEKKIEILNKVLIKVNNANSRIKELDICIQKVKSIISDSIKINDTSIYKNSVDSVQINSKNVSLNMTRVIIPSLYKSIDKLKKG